MSKEKEIESSTLQSGIGDRLTKAAQSIQRVSENVGKTIASTKELLVDKELRKKGAAYIVNEASKSFKDIQQKVGTAADMIGKNLHNRLQQGVDTIQWHLQHGPKKIQNVMERVQKRLKEARYANLLEANNNIPVDIQMGNQLFEDAPREFRTRLWFVLLNCPDISLPFKSLNKPCENEDIVPVIVATTEETPRSLIDEETKIENSENLILMDDNDVMTSVIEISQNDNNQGLILNNDSNEEEEIKRENSLIDSDWVEINVITKREINKNQHKVDESVKDDDKTSKSSENNWDHSSKTPTSENKAKTNPDYKVLSPHSTEVQNLLAAMLNIAWPLEVTYDPDSRYNVLLEITVGQDEIDEIICRDIHRTFPELPHFNIEDGQKALFNVLKAYSLHDMEVGYCQGMAFVAGILLLYLPEELAFKAFCHLMDENSIGLRRLYLPGLEALKAELWKFEYLLKRHLPILNNHLNEYGIPPVLYASQWFLTAFACPFTTDFVCRLLDVLFLESSDKFLIRAAFAVLAELGEDILAMDDFEDILTHIKVCPTGWKGYQNRKILNAALMSPITEENLEEAEKAFKEMENSVNVTSATETVNDKKQSNEDLIEFDETSKEKKDSLVGNELEVLLSMDLSFDMDNDSNNNDKY